MQYVNSCDLEHRFADEVPEELRAETIDDETFEWKIKRVPSNAWIEELVQHLPKHFPQPFLSLIQRYRFCNFEVGRIMFFANTGTDLFYELSKKVFADPHLFPTMHKNGLLEFGKPFTGDYDPICFDMKREHRRDAPIVRLDHEEILINRRIHVVEEIAPSLNAFMQRAIAEKLKVR